MKNMTIDELRLLVDNSVDCIWLFDLKSMRFKYVSPSVYDLRGVTPDEALMESLENALTPESLEIINNISNTLMPRFLEGDRTIFTTASTYEFSQYHKNGSIVEVEISIKILENKETGFIDVLGVSRNISERKKLEALLNYEIMGKNEVIAKLESSEKELENLTQQLKNQNHILSGMIGMDQLTRINNRYYFDRRIIEEAERSDRYKVPLSLILIDLDNFKRVNDQWGHHKGDEVLKKTAALIKGKIRCADIFARWGGEEFAILMPHTSIDGAKLLAEKLRLTLAEYSHPDAGCVSASFGVGERLWGEKPKLLFKRVDKALYHAKKQGRNRVILSEESISPFASMHIDWKSEWVSGNLIIDSQHKEMIEMTNQLIYIAMTEIKTENFTSKLYQFLDHASKHFNEELEIIKQTGFKDTWRHEIEHEKIMEKALRLKDSLLADEVKPSVFFSFVVDELVAGHILKEDMLFYPYL
ncbi:MAG: diguanylate cyclase [Eubacteriaceae bacterium]|nr:diguanylate cyclase [Eubacteriaceae bacterium]